MAALGAHFGVNSEQIVFSAFAVRFTTSHDRVGNHGCFGPRRAATWRRRTGYEEASRLARELEDLSAEAAELVDLADTLGTLSQTEEAPILLQAGAAVSQHIGSLFHMGKTQLFLGRPERQERRRGEAIVCLRAALSYLAPLRSPIA
jgi:hypothetical protein